MDNRMYDPQLESLKVFWEAQKQRLDLLSGMSITEEVLRQTAAFGDSEITVFEKLMKTQKMLAGLMESSSGASVSTPRGVYNPVIDDLDMSDPKTVRRFEIQSQERVGVQQGESMIPTFGVMLLLGKKDSHTDTMADFFAGKGLTVKRLEQNLTEEEAQALIADVSKEGPITGMAFAANAYDAQDQDQCAYDHTMTAVYLIKHYTIYIRELKPDWKGLVFFATFLDGKMGFTGENEHYAYGTFNGIAKALAIEFGQQAAVKLIDFQPDVAPGKMAELLADELSIHDYGPEIGRTNDGKRWTCTGVFTDARVKENRCPYGPEDVLLVTGGSRGVTSKCLMALMEKAPCKVAILGRAAINPEYMDDEETAKIPDLKEMKTLIARRFKAEGYKGPFSTIEKKAKAILDQRDMLNTFSTLEKTGCTVRYYPCDVNNREKLSAAMEQIRQELVGLYVEICESQRWETGKRLCTEADTFAYVRNVASAVGGDVWQTFRLMDRAELYDIAYGENKYPSSFSVYLTSYWEPFIFMNPSLTAWDKLTFAHEFGHFCNDYLSYGSYVGTDVAEIFSQGMEYLSLCYAEDAEELVWLKMADSLCLMVEQAAFASFEQQMYSLQGEDLTEETLRQLYAAVVEDYGFDSLGFCDWDFVTINHYYTNPMYIISYVVSNDAALQLYQMEQEEPGKGLACYQENLDTEEVNLLEFLSSAGLKSPFEPGRAAEIRLTLEQMLK